MCSHKIAHAAFREKIALDARFPIKVSDSKVATGLGPCLQNLETYVASGAPRS